MRLGQVLELACWLTGKETPEDIARFKADIEAGFEETRKARNVNTTPIVWAEKFPFQDRVPEVPDHIQGPSVRLLIGEATIIEIIQPLKVNSFLGDLDKVDLERLRLIHRRVHKRYKPNEPELSDLECDTMIEAMGPEVAFAEVRKAVDSKRLH